MSLALSIITVNLNNIHGLGKTLESITIQDNQDFEWIVIDGASNDGSKEFLEKHLDCIDYLSSEPDNGIYEAMNKGIVHAHGEYCLFLNSGDKLHDKNIISKITPELHSDDFISGDEWWVDNNYNFIKINKNPHSLTQYSLLVGILWHQCTFIKTSLLKNRPYNESLKIAADWEQMFFEIVLNNRSYRHIPYIISDFTSGGISENFELLTEERKAVLDHYLSKYEQDLIALEHLGNYRDKSHRKKIVYLAYNAFVNNYHSNRDYIKLYYPYKDTIKKYAPLRKRLLINLCLLNKMKLSKIIYNLLYSFKS